MILMNCVHPRICSVQQCNVPIRGCSLHICHFPVELLLEIFIKFTYIPCQADLRAIGEGPILLSHVCRTWRQIALKATCLWDTVNLRLNARQWDREHEIDILETWLRRSGTRPLNMRIIQAFANDVINAIPGATDLRYMVYLDRIWLCLKSHIHRCKWLHLNLPSLLQKILGRIAVGLPSLEVLTICAGSWPHRYQNRYMLDISHCPKLKMLMCRDLTTKLHLEGVHLNELRYTELEMGSADIWHILCQSRSLTSCCLKVSKQSFGTAIGPMKLTLPHLRELRLNFDGEHAHSESGLAMLLDRLCLPVLEELIVDANLGTPLRGEVWVHLSMLINRCQSPLRRIDIMGSSLLPGADLLPLFQSSPGTKEISLSYVNLTDDFWNAFNPCHECSGQYQVLCPRLELLRIVGAARQALGSMTDLILARCCGRELDSHNCDRLLEVDLEFAGFDFNDVLNYAGIKACIEDGLKLTVLSDDSHDDSSLLSQDDQEADTMNNIIDSEGDWQSEW